jgi:Fe-S-cluster-containing hydrogenase component 2
MNLIKVDQEKCTRCGLYAAVCQGILGMRFVPERNMNH